MVRGVISAAAETERERIQQNEACPLRTTSEKVILQEAIIASIIAIKLEKPAVSKNKEDCLGHNNNLVFRVCNLMISSQTAPAA